MTMRIPTALKTERFYVALDEMTAFSSWDSFREARTSLQKLAESYPKDADKVHGILRVNPGGHSWLLSKTASPPRREIYASTQDNDHHLV